MLGKAERTAMFATVGGRESKILAVKQSRCAVFCSTPRTRSARLLNTGLPSAFVTARVMLSAHGACTGSKRI